MKVMTASASSSLAKSNSYKCKPLNMDSGSNLVALWKTELLVSYCNFEWHVIGAYNYSLTQHYTLHIKPGNENIKLIIT